MTVRAGTLINDRYQIDRQIGRGGMATVWLADDRLLGRKVAVKILADRYASDPDFVERFRREASAAAKLSHSNIVAVFDRGEFEGNYYIVMEYLPGPDLKQIIRTQGPLDPRNAVDAALQILAALGAAHKRDVIHRDVKPQNVMVSEDGQLKVTDFGIARAGDDADMTEAGSVIGTAQYLSPEQARGDDVTTASDCYSVGIVLYEMLTGRVPFDGETPVSIAMRQVNEPPVAPRLLVPSIPDDLNDVVMHALEKRPGERFRTAQEFSEALLAVRAHLPVPDQRTAIMPPVEPATQVIPAANGEETAAHRATPSATPPPQPTPPKKSRRGLMVLIAIVALALIGGGAAMIFGGDDGVVVPSVTAKTAADAERELRDAGFQVQEERQYHQTIPLDHVIRTSPGAGTKADSGSTITMIVSRGQELGPVPDVTGKTWEDASTIIEDAHFEPARRDESSLDVPAGDVIRQSPAAKTQRTKGSKVTVWVSTGPATVRVPDLSLRPQGEAERTLRDLNLTPVIQFRESASRQPGLVVGQDPARNTPVDEGTEVTIYISTAPTTTQTTPTTTTSTTGASTVTVPDVVGSNYRDAARKLQAEGLPEPISGGTVAGSEADGTVVKQTPAAGTAVSASTVVTIIVSDGTGSSPAIGN